MTTVGETMSVMVKKQIYFPNTIMDISSIIYNTILRYSESLLCDEAELP